MNIKFETPIAVNYEVIRDGFTQKLFEYLKPPGVDVEIERFDGCKKDDEVHLLLKLPGKAHKWISLITHEETTYTHWRFIDEGKLLPWPISSWKHEHKVLKVDETNSIIIDDINFECNPALLTPVVAPALWVSFAFRPYKYQQYFRK